MVSLRGKCSYRERGKEYDVRGAKKRKGMGMKNGPSLTVGEGKKDPFGERKEKLIGTKKNNKRTDELDYSSPIPRGPKRGERQKERSRREGGKSAHRNNSVVHPKVERLRARTRHAGRQEGKSEREVTRGKRVYHIDRSKALYPNVIIVNHGGWETGGGLELAKEEERGQPRRSMGKEKKVLFADQGTTIHRHSSRTEKKEEDTRNSVKKREHGPRKKKKPFAEELAPPSTTESAVRRRERERICPSCVTPNRENAVGNAAGRKGEPREKVGTHARKRGSLSAEPGGRAREKQKKGESAAQERKEGGLSANHVAVTRRGQRNFLRLE